LEDAEDREVQVVEQKKDKQKTFGQTYFVVFACRIIFVAPPVSNNFCLFNLGLREINSAKSAAEKGDFSKAIGSANNAKTFFV